MHLPSFKGLQQGQNGLSASSPQAPSAGRFECVLTVNASYVTLHGLELKSSSMCSLLPDRKTVKEMIEEEYVKHSILVPTLFAVRVRWCCSRCSTTFYRRVPEAGKMLGKGPCEIRGTGPFRTSCRVETLPNGGHSSSFMKAHRPFFKPWGPSVLELRIPWMTK